MPRTLLHAILATHLLLGAACDGYLDGGGEGGEVRPFSGGTSSIATCASLRFQRGELLDGQHAETLATRELAGREDVWEDYVEFSPGASAVCTFPLPAGVDQSSVTLTLRTNYRGPRRSEMRWVFHAWDHDKRRWVLIGDNAFAGDWTWSSATLPLPTPIARFISRGEVRVRYRARSRDDASLLDEWVLLVGGTTPPPPAPDSGTTPPPAAPDSGTTPPPAPDSGATPTPPSGAIWQPTPGTSWQWQLTGSIDTSVNAQAFDIDLFDNSAALIAGLQAKGRKVICYFSTAYENWRPDAGSFPSSVLGNALDGWPGEKWVDIRATAVRDIMAKRLDLAQQKGCDGVEPDNVDAYQNKPGFPLTAADGIDFLKYLSKEAHARGLAIALKNNLEQVAQLEPYFDFAVNEECFQYNECNMLQPFISANKAVFQTEYGDSGTASSVCPKANGLNFDTLIKKLDLDAWRISCR